MTANYIFSNIFLDLKAHTKVISVFQSPFNFAIEELPCNFLLEMTNLCSIDMVNGKCQENNLTELYKCFPSENVNTILSSQTITKEVADRIQPIA